MCETAQQVPRADIAAAAWLLRGAGQQPRRLPPPLSHTVGAAGMTAITIGRDRRKRAEIRPASNRRELRVTPWGFRWHAAITAALLIAALSCSCTSDRCTCPGPEPPDVSMNYAFRVAVPMCSGCDPCWLVYWYFQCVGDSCCYLGHYDPRNDESQPEWLARVREIEACYMRTGYQCPDTAWVSSIDPTLTPRVNEEAEEMALSLSTTLVAAGVAYERVAHDLALIRRVFADSIPEVSAVTFQPYWTTNRLLVRLSASAFDLFKTEEYHDLDLLNARYGAIRVTHAIYTTILIEFSGRYRMPQLASIYTTVPSVDYAYGDRFVFICDPSTIIAWRDHDSGE